MLRRSLIRLGSQIAIARCFSVGVAQSSAVSTRALLSPFLINHNTLERGNPPAPASLAGAVRRFSGKPPLTLKTLEDRILLVLKLYDKIDPKKLTLDSNFVNDLGLDSLDHVEIIMAMEDEFGFEIPDGDADRLKTPRDLFKYICDREDVYE